jgi:hypothetical protein
LKTHDPLLLDLGGEFNHFSSAQLFNDQLAARPQGARPGVNLVEVFFSWA